MPSLPFSLGRNILLRPAFFCILFFIAAIEISMATVSADTRTVTNTLDAGNGTLRQAVIDASAGDTIIFDSTVFNGPLTITLTSGQIEITKSLVIDGVAGGVFTPTISGNNAGRVFMVGAGANVTLNRLNITRGKLNLSPGGAGIYNLGVLTVTNSLLVSNTAASDACGGGIFNDSGASLYLFNSLVYRNNALLGGGVCNGFSSYMQISNTVFISNTAVNGGGIENVNSSALNVYDSQFIGNYASSYGGAVENEAPMKVVNSTFNDNESINGGGAIQDYASLSILDSTFSNNVAGTTGGAINIALGTVFVTNSIFMSNSGVLKGGGINSINQSVLSVVDSSFVGNIISGGSFSLGGGIANDGSSTLMVANSTFNNNSASCSGGAIGNEGRLSIEESVFNRNSANNSGGGLYISTPSAVVFVTSSMLMSNTTSSGGGIAVLSGTLNVLNSSFVSNTVSDGGGGLSNQGGAIVVVNSTFVYNRSTNSLSGGIYNCSAGCALTVINSTIARNAGPAAYAGGITNDGTAVLTNTIVAANTSSNCSGNGFINSFNNLDSGSTCHFPPANGSLSNTNPLLGELGYYLGQVQTIPLLPGSPAIDAGTCAGALIPMSDGRGIPRPQPAGGACDIGAFESRGFAFGAPVGTPQTALTHQPFALPLSVSVISAYSEPVEGGRVILNLPSAGAGATVQPASPLALTGGAVATIATANAISGSYVITASARGTTGPVYFNLTNQTAYYTLTVNTVGAGSVSSRPAGPSFADSTVVTLTATPALSTSLAGWSGNCSLAGADCVVTMTADTLVTATFTLKTYTLGVAHAGTGSGTVSRVPPGSVFDYGTVVTLTATPAPNSSFGGWSANCSLAGANCVVTMTAGTLVTATFTLNTYTLTMTASGNGIVTPNVGVHVYPQGAVLTLTATPQRGWGFVGWSGDLPGAGRTNPVTITINSNKTVSATFSLRPIADAGASRAVKTKTQVTLDGSGSSGTHLPLIYRWRQSSGQAVVMNSTTISRPVFAAPAAVTLTQSLVFSLVVTDSLGVVSEPSQVAITVVPYRANLPVVYRKTD